MPLSKAGFTAPSLSCTNLALRFRCVATPLPRPPIASRSVFSLVVPQITSLARPHRSSSLRTFVSSSYSLKMTTIPKTMRAAVIRQPGGPDVLKVEEIPVPTPASGEVLIKIMAAGMNRSEMFTRQGV
jgi:hypothetical protein